MTCRWTPMSSTNSYWIFMFGDRIRGTGVVFGTAFLGKVIGYVVPACLFGSTSREL